MIDTFLFGVKDSVRPKLVGSFNSRHPEFKQRFQNALGTLGPLHEKFDVVKKTSVTDVDFTLVSRIFWNNGKWKEEPAIIEDLLDRGLLSPRPRKKPAG